MNSPIVAIGASLTALGIGIGAFGAHALRDILSPYGHEIFKTASVYHLIHGLAIVCLALLRGAGIISPTAARRVAGLFVFGILIFSGSLYLLAVTEVRWLGAITPIGGVSLITGWVILALSALKSENAPFRIDNPSARG